MNTTMPSPLIEEGTQEHLRQSVDACLESLQEILGLLQALNLRWGLGPEGDEPGQPPADIEMPPAVEEYLKRKQRMCRCLVALVTNHLGALDREVGEMAMQVATLQDAPIQAQRVSCDDNENEEQHQP